MKPKLLLGLALVLSGGLLAIIFPVSYHLKDGIAITSDFHVGFFDGNVSFYSNDKPYTGSIVSIASHDTNEVRYPVLVTLARGVDMNIGDTHEVRWGWHTADDNYNFGQITFIRNHGEIVMDRERFCTLPGVYFRHFWMLGYGKIRAFWTFTLSLWYPILLLAVLLALWVFWRRRLWFRKAS
jgi:hypothetical protein